MYVRMCITMTVCYIEFIHYHMSVTGQTNMDSHAYFFLVVKTALGLGRVVGTIIPQFETSQLIAKALSILSKWNPDWKPQYIITDRSFVELEAIAEIFPTCIR